MREFARPRVISSKCVEFEACRYNGAMIPSPVVRLLQPHVDFQPVCPEVEIGLGIPRNPIRIVKSEGALRLIQPDTGADLTGKMQSFTREFLDSVEDVDGFILKFRSPSCGMKEVKIYKGPEKGAAASKGAGFFGGAVLKRFGELAVEDEGRLRDYRIREHFLTKLFALAAFRKVRSSGKMRELVRFQSENKLLLMASSQKHLRLMGRIVANPDRLPVAETIGIYESHLMQALASPPRSPSCINVLMHAMGYFKDALARREKEFFLESMEDYRQKRVPLSVPVGIMKSYILRFGEPYLASQTFFEPYPGDLLNVTDSGKGRDL
jgi:uncharacterized protein YbgA (DUF1722 family)/uncharacterized protein YbbK (DUF523 family)